MFAVNLPTNNQADFTISVAKIKESDLCMKNLYNAIKKG